ncbi:MAG: putative TetR-family transcriptional regulator [Microbacterium sp.]|jgi:AcrR family transcriptional regulator|nr:putative TetR-family transcriptional regulator [Microbacterium sp.]
MAEIGQRTGRPRDPEIRARVLLAAQRVYVASGRSGLTFDAVARESGAGKPAIYRRWASPDDLLDDVLRSHELEPARTDRDDIRGQLCEIALAVLRLMHSDQGGFILRVSAERASQSAVFDQYFERLRTVIHVANRGLVLAAMERGELSDRCDPDVLLQAITGSALVGTLMGFAPSPYEDQVAAERYCESIVDQALRGARASTA